MPHVVRVANPMRQLCASIAVAFLKKKTMTSHRTPKHSVRVLLRQDRENGLEEDLDIEPGGPLADVLVVARLVRSSARMGNVM